MFPVAFSMGILSRHHLWLDYLFHRNTKLWHKAEVKIEKGLLADHSDMYYFLFYFSNGLLIFLIIYIKGFVIVCGIHMDSRAK